MQSTDFIWCWCPASTSMIATWVRSDAASLLVLVYESITSAEPSEVPSRSSHSGTHSHIKARPHNSCCCHRYRYQSRTEEDILKYTAHFVWQIKLSLSSTDRAELTQTGEELHDLFNSRTNTLGCLVGYTTHATKRQACKYIIKLRYNTE